MSNVAVLQDRRAPRKLRPARGCYGIAVREAWAMLDEGELTPAQFLTLCYEAARDHEAGGL